MLHLLCPGQEILLYDVVCERLSGKDYVNGSVTEHGSFQYSAAAKDFASRSDMGRERTKMYIYFLSKTCHHNNAIRWPVSQRYTAAGISTQPTSPSYPWDLTPPQSG